MLCGLTCAPSLLAHRGLPVDAEHCRAWYCRRDCLAGGRTDACRGAVLPCSMRVAGVMMGVKAVPSPWRRVLQRSACLSHDAKAASEAGCVWLRL